MRARPHRARSVIDARMRAAKGPIERLTAQKCAVALRDPNR